MKRPNVIKGGKVYRLAQDDELPEEFTEEPSEPAKGPEFSFQTLQLSDDEIAAVGRMLVLGVAMALGRQGVTKDQLKKAKPQQFSAALPRLLKDIISARSAILQELRMLLRFGPEQYLQRRARDIKNAL